MAKLLLVHPDFSRLGGIENYFLKICPHLEISHESCGNSRRPGEKGLIRRLQRIVGDYLIFWKKVPSREVDIVHLNTALESGMFFRDWIYFYLAKLYRKKTLVFIHGWEMPLEQKIERNDGRLLRRLYGGADAYIVLAAAFESRLRQWGIEQPIHREVIVIEDEIFQQIRLDELLEQRHQAPIKNLLFPARLIRAKGLFTVIQALAIVQQKREDVGLIIAGDGEDADAARQMVAELQLKNTLFTGIVHGEDKYRLFEQSHLLCFPTEYGEGFPNTIVEAMAFGLPVITRPMGGVSDFFEHGRHGYISDSIEPAVFAGFIEQALADTDACEKIARCNHQYAGEHLLASQAAARLQQIYASL